MFWLIVIACCLFGLGLGLAPFRKLAFAGLAIACVPLMIAVLWIAYEMNARPGSHNLFPFELAGITGLITLPVSGGLCAGYMIRKFVTVPPAAYMGLLVSALAIAVCSPVFVGAVNQVQGNRAVETLKQLWAAEQDYAAANPAHDYTCEGWQLPGFQKENWYSNGLTADRSGIWRDDFGFTLCGMAGLKGDQFSIEAASPNAFYCIGKDGQVKESATPARVPCFNR
jgi:hypothetical protein